MDQVKIALLYRDNDNLRKSEVIARITEKASFVHVFPFGTSDEEVKKVVCGSEFHKYRDGWTVFADLTCFQYLHRRHGILIRQGDFELIDLYIAQELPWLAGKRVFVVTDFLGCQYRMDEGGDNGLSDEVTAKWDRLALERWESALKGAGIDYTLIERVGDERFVIGDDVAIVVDHHRTSRKYFQNNEQYEQFFAWWNNGGVCVDSSFDENVHVADDGLDYYLKRAVK